MIPAMTTTYKVMPLQIRGSLKPDLLERKVTKDLIQ